MGEAERDRGPGSVDDQVRGAQHQLTPCSTRSGASSHPAFRRRAAGTGSDRICRSRIPGIQSRQESASNQGCRTPSGLRPRSGKGQAYPGLDKGRWPARTEGVLARRERLQANVPAGGSGPGLYGDALEVARAGLPCRDGSWENMQLPKSPQRSRSMNVGSWWRQQRNTRNTAS